MEHKGDGPTSRERAVHEATQLIDSLGADDSVNVLLMEPNPATCFVEFLSGSMPRRSSFSESSNRVWARADVNLANAPRRAAATKTMSRPEVYYISDFQRKNWANANFTALPPAAKLFFVDVGPIAPRQPRDARRAALPSPRCWPATLWRWRSPSGNFSAEPNLTGA